MKVYIPSNIDLSKERHADKYYYIISTITCRRIFDKSIKKNDFVPISSKILRNVINSRYKERINNLLEMGIIEVDDSYLTGEWSKGYRVSPEYQNQKLKMVNIHDKRINQKVSEFNADKLKEIILPQHKYIYDCLQQVDINEKEAIKYVNENVYEYEKNSIHKIMINNLKRIKTNCSWEIGKTGRIYNNVTNFPRDLRKFLRWQKTPLQEKDISNSQPVFFNKLIDDYIQDHFHTTSPSTTLLENPIYVSTISETLLYKNLTTKGIFYDYLMERFIKGHEQYDYLLDDLIINEPRDIFKKIFFGRVFYCEDKWITNEREEFKILFPHVSEIVTYYKKDNYKNLANSLQKLESDLIINHVVPRLSNQNIYCLTIHDSILTTPDKLETVKEIILNEFENQYGIVPTIKIK